VDIPAEKATGEYRILALGDSFTEGVGTPYEATWVKVLERELAARSPGHRVTTINAGISGSDIGAEYMLLREKLLSYHPDLVIVAINITDVWDITLRGGLERFRPDGSVGVPHAAPPWEWLYGISYLSRPVVHGLLGYDEYLIARSAVSARQQAAVADMRATVTAFTTLAEEHGFRLLFLLHPLAYEVEQGHYDPVFDGFVAGVKQMPGIEALDVLGEWQARQILTPENVWSFYWPIDWHHNAQGYAALGQAAAEKVLRMNMLRNR
jgi:lysophospholipase L1-like esterase